MSRSVKISDITEENYNFIFNTNVKGVLIVSQAVACGMVADKRGGAIVNISSITSRRGDVGDVLYGSSKGALDQITRCMAVELGPHQIRVNSIHPNLVPETPMGRNVYENDVPTVQKLMRRTPRGRLCKIEDIVNAALFLLSEKADMINGALLPVDGGLWCT